VRTASSVARADKSVLVTLILAVVRTVLPLRWSVYPVLVTLILAVVRLPFSFVSRRLKLPLDSACEGH
jgi:hypothetical protein